VYHLYGAAHIEGMSRCAPTCTSQAVELPKTRTHCPGSVLKISAVAPRGYGDFCFGSELGQPIVVKWTDRISYELEDPRIGGPIGEEVGHDYSAISPHLSESDASPESRIIRIRVRCRRI
jgi:hypothetical protein